MTAVLTVRMDPSLLTQAGARAAQLGLDRSGYVRDLITRDVTDGPARGRPRFASEDLAGAYRLGGRSATNARVRERLRARRAA